MGAVGLEPTETEVEGFTVPCNCRYATPPEGKDGIISFLFRKDCWRKELNPQPSDYKSGALPIELRQQKIALFYSVSFFSSTTAGGASGTTGAGGRWLWKNWVMREALAKPLAG